MYFNWKLERFEFWSILRLHRIHPYGQASKANFTWLHQNSLKLKFQRQIRQWAFQWCASMDDAITLWWGNRRRNSCQLGDSLLDVNTSASIQEQDMNKVFYFFMCLRSFEWRIRLSTLILKTLEIFLVPPSYSVHSSTLCLIAHSDIADFMHSLHHNRGYSMRFSTQLLSKLCDHSLVVQKRLFGGKPCSDMGLKRLVCLIALRQMNISAPFLHRHWELINTYILIENGRYWTIRGIDMLGTRVVSW